MCLSSVTKLVRPHTSQEIVAWKVFSKFPRNELHLPYYNTLGLIPFNKWVKANPCNDHGENYKPYFHAFTTRHGARNFLTRLSAHDHVVRKVILRYVTLFGRQDGCEAVVAKEMKVPRPGG